jgi:hypothetical protein
MPAFRSDDLRTIHPLIIVGIGIHHFDLDRGHGHRAVAIPRCGPTWCAGAVPTRPIHEILHRFTFLHANLCAGSRLGPGLPHFFGKLGIGWRLRSFVLGFTSTDPLPKCMSINAIGFSRHPIPGTGADETDNLCLRLIRQKRLPAAGMFLDRRGAGGGPSGSGLAVDFGFGAGRLGIGGTYSAWRPAAPYAPGPGLRAPRQTTPRHATFGRMAWDLPRSGVRRQMARYQSINSRPLRVSSWM